ncbi:Thiamin-phosphate pyrophosphorylase [hydrothermal vent metagenome]|uniref:thiamine phosphate synthase n=1 Tax=hydrothermal vent metagenome TaxID=652676 RepID=A0A3B0WDH4_9ZZZZ
MTARNVHREKLKGLYAITDENLITEKNFKQSVESALQGGSKIIQYRDKSNDQQKRFLQASIVSTLCKKYQAVSIINDDIELAKAVDADGVHLGKDDALVFQARQVLGNNSIIGVSCYNKLDLAINAEKNNADYVAFGAMFSSATKPNASNAEPALISTAKKQLSIPVCAIGGINDKNIRQIRQYGADIAAVISHLFSSNNIKQTAETLSKKF